MIGSSSARAALRIGFHTGASVMALGAATQAGAQSACTGMTRAGVCVIENSGDSGQRTIASPVILINSGTISGAPAITGTQTGPQGGVPTTFGLRIVNESGGTITGTAGTAISSPGAIVNAGTINGGIVGATSYIADGGTLNGNLTLGSTNAADFSTQTFVQRGATTGVTGTITAGGGTDIYARSFSGGGSIFTGIASLALPTSFEVRGVEVRGADTTVTLTGPTTVTEPGLALLGDGNVVNAARVGTYNTSGAGYPASVQIYLPAVGYQGIPESAYSTLTLVQTSPIGAPPTFTSYGVLRNSALNSFTNNGIITGDVRMTTARFVNNRTITVQSRAIGSLIFTAEDRDFEFVNNGGIALSDTGVRGGLAATEQLLGDEGATYAMRVRTYAATTGRTITLTNDGGVAGGFAAHVAGQTVSFRNNGQLFGGTSTSFSNHGLILSVGRVGGLGAPETELAANTVTFVNGVDGEIEDGARIDAIARDFRFTNAGSIRGGSEDPRALGIDHEGAAGGDAGSFAFDNGGVLTGDVILNTNARDASVVNSGTIAMPVRDTDDFGFNVEALEFAVETAGDQTVSFANGGTIRQDNRGATAVSLELEVGDGAATTGSSSVAIVNTGTIRSDAGGQLVDGRRLGEPAGTVLLDAAVALSVEVAAPTASVAIENRAGGVISATGSHTIVDADGNRTAATANAGAYSTALLVSTGGDVSITNAGTITGGEGGALPAGAVFSRDADLADGFLAGAIQTGASTDRIVNLSGGSITGSIDLGAGDDTIENYGAINGNVYLRGGDDRFLHLLSASITGTVDGGDGEDSLIFDITGTDGSYSQALRDQFVNFELFSLVGTGTVALEDGGDLALGVDTTITAPEGGNAVQGGEQGESVSNAGTVNGNVDLGGGDNRFANSGTVNGNVATGGGADSVQNSGTIAGNVDLGGGSNSFENTGRVEGDVASGDGGDTFRNSGTVTGNVSLGGGSDTYVLAGGTVGGTVDGGPDDAIDRIVFSLPSTATTRAARTLAAVAAPAATATIDAATLGAVTGFEQLVLDGSGTVSASGTLNVGTIVLQGAALSVAAGTTLATGDATTVTGSAGADAVYVNGTVAGGIALGDGADTLAVGGRIGGAVDLGAGDDTLTIGSGASFGGAVSGGAGNDSIVLATAGTDAARFEFAAGGFAGFERLANTAGVAALSGAATFAQIDVTGGRLIGLAGSTLTGNVAVASGATFGSAGRVIGNVAVASGGTLSPGASPGVMSVTGNVSLAGGSLTVFEFQPSPLPSDQLVISGALTIASGATLTLTGNRPLTPGTPYDLIIASGGITGTFATVNQASTVLGFLRYSSDRLQLLGTFVAPSGVSPQVRASIDYVNGVLVAGAGSALLSAVPALLSSDGTANAAAFARVGPEPYATALELGTANGLLLANTARAGMGAGAGEEARPFTFAHGLGDWRRFDGTAAGVSRATSESYGLVGGIGYGNASGSIAAFVGAVDSRQRIAGLGARTGANGYVAGIVGQVASDGFDASALVAYDFSHATTQRAAAAGAGLSSNRYRLHSFVADVQAGYAVPLSAGWAARPALGLTHVATDRGAATESGNAAFALAVDKRDRSVTFVDGSLALKGGLEEGATFQPWVQGGVRHRIGGGLPTATARFVGAGQAFTLAGASRGETVATAGAGASVELGTGFRLYGAYQAEFGAGGSHNLNLGVRLGF